MAGQSNTTSVQEQVRGHRREERPHQRPLLPQNHVRVAHLQARCTQLAERQVGDQVGRNRRLVASWRCRIRSIWQDLGDRPIRDPQLEAIDVRGQQ